jgi:hypothetical protein
MYDYILNKTRICFSKINNDSIYPIKELGIMFFCASQGATIPRWSLCWNTYNFEILNFRFCFLEIKVLPKKRKKPREFFWEFGLWRIYFMLHSKPLNPEPSNF